MFGGAPAAAHCLYRLNKSQLLITFISVQRGITTAIRQLQYETAG